MDLSKSRWVLLMCALLSLNNIQAADKQKILLINSYHSGYEWSDGIEEGIEQVLDGGNIELHRFYMDSKRERDTQSIQVAALKAKSLIETLQPDVVIVSDDNAVKFVVQQHYRGSGIPFVFCGVNWDASIYGFPQPNVTGMEEVALLKPIEKHLSEYAKGNRIGLLAIDALSNRRNKRHFEKVMGRVFEKPYFVNSFSEWKQHFIQLQQEVDMLILENPNGLEGWDNEVARIFVEANTKIPSATTHVWLAPYALLTMAKIPQEQGRWAAKSALRILNGEQAGQIPIVQNQHGKLFINLRLSEPMGIVFRSELIEIAEVIR